MPVSYASVTSRSTRGFHVVPGRLEADDGPRGTRRTTQWPLHAIDTPFRGCRAVSNRPTRFPI